MEKFLREPLVQFMAIGAVLFGVFSLIGKLDFEKPRQIVVSAEQIDVLNKGFVFDFGRPPTPEDTEKLVEDYIREEVLVQEAVKAGLHVENQNVRVALRRLMEERYSAVPIPTDQDLEAFLTENPDRFRTTPDQPVPPLAQIKPTVRTVWQATKRKEALDAGYQSLRKGYNIVIHKPSTPARQATSNPQ